MFIRLATGCNCFHSSDVIVLSVHYYNYSMKRNNHYEVGYGLHNILISIYPCSMLKSNLRMNPNNDDQRNID